jgi:hypothetical protein
MKKRTKTQENLKEDDNPPSSEPIQSKLPEGEPEKLCRLRQEFNLLFDNVDDEKAQKLSSETREFIAFVQSRIEEWSGNRSGSVQISLGMFAFSIAGLALISDPSKIPGRLYIYPFALPFLCGLLITSLLHFILISRQVSFHYPFIDVSQAWRWFYLYSSAKDMPFRTRLSKTEQSRSKQLFIEGLIQYAKDTIQLDPKSDLRQNLEQLYLLLVYEGYIIRFALATNNLLRIREYPLPFFPHVDI